MRTFARKQNQPQKPVSSSVARSNTTILGRNHHVNPLLHLQRTIGHQAAQAASRNNVEERKAGLNGKASPLFGHDFSRIPIHPPTAIQPTLKVGEPNDKFEQEADRVADKVMKMTEALPPANAISSAAPIQRQPVDVNEPIAQMAPKEEDKKAELEFTSTVDFNSGESGFKPTGPPKDSS